MRGRNRHTGMDDQRKDDPHPKISTRLNIRQQLQMHKILTDNVENTNGIKHMELIYNSFISCGLLTEE